ncbi:MAG: hypothetical protein HXX09_12565 [Bacteroidetes bacterium]|nr:hypothetical protein [Bacteroidota bacterium]
METYSIILQTLALLGVVIALVTYIYSKKTSKAKFVHELNLEYNSNKKYLEIFNKIEWEGEIDLKDERFKYEAEGFFAFFEYIVYLRFNKILHDNDFNIYRYMLIRVLTCNDIKVYLKQLEDFSSERKINFPYLNLKRYSELYLK